MKAERLIKSGCEGYNTFIMEDKQPQVVEDIPVVRKFPNILLEEILKLPFVRERDFTIDLIPGTAPISKASYRMALAELKEPKSNDLFSLFLDETMTYSCAVFKTENEDLKVAQLRKITMLIEKARIHSKHEVLEIGFGWGSLAIEVVKRTGCKYTGITLSAEQLKYAERRVKEAGLEDHIKLLLCDYRQLPCSQKYDRIISCEMLEAVGHEYMEEFFGCCESVLAEDGVLVLQFISIPDERYDEYRRSSDFIKEYIFPGGCLPSLSRVTSAMAAASRLCVEHVENIGIHYYQTLRCWRKNFTARKSKVLAMGFDEQFIRTWDYYFIYSAAGFNSLTLADYQVIFSRPGNLAAFSDPPYLGLLGVS